MNAYDHLVEMCSAEQIRANIASLHHDRGLPTARLKYIMSHKRHGKGKLHSYHVGHDAGHNFYRIINVGAPSTVVFMAHHDVANPNSQNCNDNTASVCHLLELAKRFSRNRKDLKHNVVLAWVDHEERCSTDLAGSSQLAKQIKAGDFGNVVAVYNLELTACGTHYWYSDEHATDQMVAVMDINNFEEVNCPINDAVHMQRQGVSAVCIGSYRAIDRYIVVETKRAGCELWRSCHAEYDRYDIWAVEADMKKFNDVLYGLVDMHQETDTNVVFNKADYVSTSRWYGSGRPQAPSAKDLARAKAYDQMKGKPSKPAPVRVRDHYHCQECPDCFKNIPYNAVEGDACKDCGHVFSAFEEVDEVVYLPAQGGFDDPTYLDS